MNRTFTVEELRLLRASDRVVDQQEPGGVLYRRDREYRRRRPGTQPITSTRIPRTNP